MLPTVVACQAQVDLDEGTPLWPFRFADQMHPRLRRSTIGLVGIAGDTRTNNVLPRRGPSPVPRNDVVQVEVLAVKNFPAILAGILIPLENVMPGEFDLLLRQPIKE